MARVGQARRRKARLGRARPASEHTGAGFACRVYPFYDCGELRREGNGSRSGERAGELNEDRQVGVKLDALKATNSERKHRPLVLETAKLSLHGGATLVELAPARRLTRDQRVKAVRLDPPACRTAGAGGAAPLPCTPLGIRAGEPPLAMLTGWWLVSVPFHGGRLAQRDDRAAVAVPAFGVDPPEVIALVECARRGLKAALARRVEQRRDT
jgi:hypothetical protein